MGIATAVEGKFNQVDAEVIDPLPSILTGNHFDLAIEAHHVNFTGRQVKALKINGTLPGPTLKWREGDTVTIAVTNHLPDATSIHWHGIRVPAPMDGVPGLSFAGIAPGKTFVYRFPVLQNGTYWYHSHSGFQEQLGLWGALVIEPRDTHQVHAGVQGKVLAVYVKEGDAVQSGQVMARLQSLNEASAREEAAAQVASTQAQVFSAELQHSGLGPALAAQQAARRSSASISARPTTRQRECARSLDPARSASG